MEDIKNKPQSFDRSKIPVIKGDILKLGAISIGSNGDIMFKKDGYVLFLKNPKNRTLWIGQQIELKVVKIYPKVGYVEMVR